MDDRLIEDYFNEGRIMFEYIEYFNGGLFQGGWILFDYMENIL